MFDIKPQGALVKARCSCGTICDCIIKTFSDGTKHAWGTCSDCGKTNAKQQQTVASLDDISHRLLSVKSAVLAIPKGEDRDEAIAMLERLCEELSTENE